MADWRKYGQLASGWGCLRMLALHEYEHIKTGDGRRSRALTKYAKEFSREAGLEFFNWYVLITTSRRALKQIREMRKTWDLKMRKLIRPPVELRGYYFQEEILKRARQKEIDTEERRRKDRIRKQRERARKAVPKYYKLVNQTGRTLEIAGYVWDTNSEWPLDSAEHAKKILNQHAELIDGGLSFNTNDKLFLRWYQRYIGFRE